ncbi:MAG: aminotransferase class IV family protein [Halarcobacter sp.]
MEYFETIKCFDNEIFNLQYHNKRVANTIGLNLNLQEYIYPPSEKLYRCKLIYNEYEVLDVQYFEYKKREIKSFKLIFDDNIEYSKKYLNREDIDKAFGKKQNADEIIIVKNGLLTDTSIANIAIYDGTNWLTPTIPLLFGTTRERFIEEKKMIEKPITVQMLKSAKKIALLNAMIDFDILDEYTIEV